MVFAWLSALFAGTHCRHNCMLNIKKANLNVANLKKELNAVYDILEAETETPKKKTQKTANGEHDFTGWS